MARFLRSKQLRDALWLAADGKCESCGCDLPKDWHADHVVPWSVSERTNVHEMQALCLTCNLEKGKKMPMLYDLETYPGIRKGIQEALICFRDWLRETHRLFQEGEIVDWDWSCIIPTRYGKSDFIRTAALIGVTDRLTGPCLVVSPAVVLAEQLLEKQRVAAWRRRWGIHYSRPVVTLSDFGPRPFQNDEWLGSIHVQALVRKTELVKDFANHLLHKYELPPVMFLDETHRYTLANRWGDVPRAWLEGGGLVVPVTATGFRHDGDDLLGYERVIDSREDETRHYARPHPDPDKVFVITEIGERIYYRLKADFEVSFKRGWDEKAISKSSVDWLDVKMNEVVNGVTNEDAPFMLSEIPRSRVSRCLTGVCRDRKVILNFCRKILLQLRTFRAHETTADATAVIYGLSDVLGAGANAHLEEIKNVLLSLDPTLVIQIATLAADEATTAEERKAVKIIARFCDPNGKTIDILLLKQMGAEGLDSPRIRVVGTLDAIRSAVAKIQQWGRGGNIWGSCRHFVIVSLMDKLAQEIHKAHIEDLGGQATEFEIDESWSEVKTKQEPEDLPLFRVADVIQSGSTDCDGLTCTPLEYSCAYHLLEELPELIATKSIPVIAGIAKRLDVGPLPDDGEGEAPNVADETAAAIGALYELVKAGARLLFRLKHGRFPDFGNKEERDEFGREHKPEFVRRVKTRAGVSGSWDQKAPDRIRHVETLQLCLAAARQLIAEMTRETL